MRHITAKNLLTNDKGIIISMRALVKKNYDDDFLTLEEIEKPKVKPGELLVEVHAAGICGSDIHILNNEYPSTPPVVLGHEYSGIVSELGEGVDQFSVGDRVVSLTAVQTCGKCRYCMQGLRMLCKQRKSIGSGINGAFSEFITIPANLSFKIPDNISMDEAVLSEPLACVVRGVLERGKANVSEYIYVSGPGIIGQLAVQIAAANGCYVVVGGTKKDKNRLDLAIKNGAKSSIVVDEENFHDRIGEETEGQGFDVVYECSGAQASSQFCLQVVKRGGRYNQLGLFGNPIKFDMDLALMKEVEISNSYASEWTSWERALYLQSQGKVNLKSLIGPKFPLEKWQEAFKTVINKQSFKVFLVP